MQAGAATLGAGALASGVFLALGRDSGGAADVASVVSTATANAPAETPTATAANGITPDQPGTVSASVQEASPEVPATSEPAGAQATAAGAGARPVSQPATATPPPTVAATGGDIPLYKDTDVLARAAPVVLPSGKTFEQCVALGPNGKHWPVPVHLYYEGKGKWLVETHLSEVQVEFSEATASFRVRHFAPEASECL